MAAKDEGPTRAAIALTVAYLRDDTDAAASVLAPYLESPCGALTLISELVGMLVHALMRTRDVTPEAREKLADGIQSVLRTHAPKV